MRTTLVILSLLMLGSGPTPHDLRLTATLKGTWRQMSLNEGGTIQPGNGTTWTFAGGGHFTVEGGPGPTTVFDFTLDPVWTPAWIDLSSAARVGVWYGLYRVRDGVLEVRTRTMANLPRPEHIDGPVGETEELAVYKRVR